MVKGMRRAKVVHILVDLVAVNVLVVLLTVVLAPDNVILLWSRWM